MCLITLQETCHKSCHKFGAATSKWSRLWCFRYSTYHLSSWRKPSLSYSYNEHSYIQSIALKKNDVPISKTGQHKERFKMQKKSTVTQYLLFMSFGMPM